MPRGPRPKIARRKSAPPGDSRPHLMSLISQAGRGRCVVAAALLAAGAGAFFVGLARRSHSDRSTIVTAAQALRGRDFDRAEALARDVLADHPDDAAALLLAGEAASRAGR